MYKEGSVRNGQYVRGAVVPKVCESLELGITSHVTAGGKGRTSIRYSRRYCLFDLLLTIRLETFQPFHNDIFNPAPFVLQTSLTIIYAYIYKIESTDKNVSLDVLIQVRAGSLTLLMGLILLELLKHNTLFNGRKFTRARRQGCMSCIILIVFSKC